MPAARKSTAAAVRLAAEQGIATAPATQKPIPAGVDWPSIVARGYHVLWGRTYNWNLQSFFNLTIKHHMEKVVGRDFDELSAHDHGGYANIPIQFVKDAPATSGTVFAPITTVDDLKVGITNLRREWNDFDPYQPRNTEGTDTSLHVGRDEWYKAEMFANATDDFPADYALAYHITKRRFVGFASWAFNRVADDRAVSAGKPTLAKPAKKPYGYAKSKAKPASTAKKKGGSLIIDTKGLMVFGKLSPTDKTRFGGEINEYRSHNLDGIATSTTTLVFNNIVLTGDEEQASSSIGLVADEDNNFSGYWKGKLAQKGYVFSTGVLQSVEHFMRIRKSMTEDDYAKAWMHRFMEKGAKEVTELEKKQLKLQQEALGVSKQLGDARFMQDLMREGGLNAFKSKLKSLATVPGVEGVSFLPDGIALTTEEITMPYQEKVRFIGRFYIVLDLMGNKVTIQNLMQGPKMAVHPFVGEGGSYFCLGSYSGILSQALATSDYEILAMTMLELLRDVQGLTHSGKTTLAAWTTERPETFAPGKVVTIYQGHGVTAVAGGGGYDEDEDDYED